MSMSADSKTSVDRLAGGVCEALICEAYSHRSTLIDPANVIWLRTEGRWYRIFFDEGVLYFRVSNSSPKAYEMPELSSAVALSDIGERYAVNGRRILRVSSSESPRPTIAMEFEGGDLITFHENSGKTEYRKAAQPGATDNPDDAQRLREDY